MSQVKDTSKKCVNKADDTRSRYNSLIKRSFELLLRYKLFEQQCPNKKFASKCFVEGVDEKLDKECFSVDRSVKEAFSNLYDEMSNLKTVNDDARKFIEGNKKNIRTFKKAYKKHFQEYIMSEVEFEKLWHAPRKCGYCGISEDQIKELCEKGELQTKRLYSRGKTMEIDKIEPNGEYCKKNIILSCYWCNNAKTDEFSLTEFEPIARGIHKAWEKRLKSFSENNEIYFPDESYERVKT